MEFKRGIDVRKSLKLGKYRKVYNPIKKDWQNLESGTYILTFDNIFVKISWDLKNTKYSTYRWNLDKKVAINSNRITNEYTGYPFDYSKNSHGIWEIIIEWAQMIINGI